jgi:hypothetical protein
MDINSIQTIDLDCAPGSLRPGDLIGSVLEGTGLVAPETSSRFFGNWTWTFTMDRDEWVERIQPIIKPRIEALYHNGAIRYGSW